MPKSRLEIAQEAVQKAQEEVEIAKEEVKIAKKDVQKAQEEFEKQKRIFTQQWARENGCVEEIAHYLKTEKWNVTTKTEYDLTIYLKQNLAEGKTKI